MPKADLERRRAPRAAVSIPIQLSPRGDATPATLTNLSTSGLGCQFGEAIGEMTLVGIDLDLPGAKGPTRVTGVVVRCDKIRGMNPPTYEIGVFFTDMADATRAVVTEFVERQLAGCS
jgi:PilZ domain